MPRVRSLRPAGRPPAADSAETQHRIIVAARKAFAQQGYAGTTNQVVAGMAGIATGTIYHYFESKQDLYLSVSAETQALIFGTFEAAAGRASTLPGQLSEMLHAALELHERDATLAPFSAAEVTDLLRHPELSQARLKAGIPSGDGLMQRLVQDARARGEVADGVSDAALLRAIAVLMSGLAYQAAVQPDLVELRALFSAVDLMLDGKLFTTGRGWSRDASPGRSAQSSPAAGTAQPSRTAKSARRVQPPDPRQPPDDRPTRSTLT